MKIGVEAHGAVVGAGGVHLRAYLWILSRRPTMDEALYQDLLSRVAGHGYDLTRIERTAQPAE